MESPGLWGWFGGGTNWEWWVVGVDVDTGGGLAGLDGKLGSVSQEFLGSTAAESLIACWSLQGSSNVLVGTWGVLSTTGTESGLGVIGSLDGGSGGSISGGLVDEGFLGSHGFVVSETLACSDGLGESSFSGGDCKSISCDSRGIGSEESISGGLASCSTLGGQGLACGGGGGDTDGCALEESELSLVVINDALATGLEGGVAGGEGSGGILSSSGGSEGVGFLLEEIGLDGDISGQWNNEGSESVVFNNLEGVVGDGVVVGSGGDGEVIGGPESVVGGIGGEGLVSGL